MARPSDEKKADFEELAYVKDYEATPFLGPHSLVYSNFLNCLYFTDSGPFGETGIENPKGSVFKIDLEQ